MRKRELEEELARAVARETYLRNRYLGVEQLLTDLGLIFPNLVNEHWDNAWYQHQPTPQIVHKLKQREIHLVAQHYRDIQERHDQECRIDDAMTNIGL